MAIENAKSTYARKRLSLVVRDFLQNEDGATAIEYSLIAGLIFLAIVASVRAYTSTTSDMYNEISSTIDDA